MRILDGVKWLRIERKEEWVNLVDYILDLEGDVWVHIFAAIPCAASDLSVFVVLMSDIGCETGKRMFRAYCNSIVESH